MVFPVGRLHVMAANFWPLAARLGPPATPLTSRPARSTRSPSGPHWNAPGSATGNRHVRWSPAGLRAHAWPPATNATVSEAAGAAGVQAGKATPDASVAPPVA